MMSPVQTSFHEIVCWHCAQPGKEGELFCVQCHHLQPPFSCDIFTHLGVEARFDLAENDLHQRYIRLQQQLHPDRFVTRTSQEKAYALEHSAALNEAYDSLKNPYQRALHLLALKGYDINSTSALTLTDPILLEEMLDLRERLAEADNEERILEVYQEIYSLHEQTLDALTDAFTAQRYEDAQALTHRLHYLQKMLQACPQITSSGASLT